MLGHLIGAAAGYIALAAFGLTHSPSVISGGLTAPRIGAAALSIALTSAAMILARVEHGPAGATTLIVSLGFMTSFGSLGLLMTGVVALIACGILIDRSVGLQVPYWSQPRKKEHRSNRRIHLVRLPLGRARLPDNFDNRPSANVHRREPAEQRWVVAADEGRRLVIGPEACRVKVEDSATDSTYALLEVDLAADRPGTLLHAHYDLAEAYIVTHGEVVAEIGTERVHAYPGEVVCIPPGVPHLLTCARHDPARLWCITKRSSQSEPEFLP